MLPLHVLIVEDEFVIANNLRDMLLPQVAAVYMASTAAEAERVIEQQVPDLVLLDIMLRGERDGIALGHRLTTHYGVPFVYITSHADKLTLQAAVATQPRGYILKPFKEAEILAAVRQSAAPLPPAAPLAADLAPTTAAAAVTATAPVSVRIIGPDPATEAVRRLLERIAPATATVLLQGETGTGKEVFARALHAWSPRRSGPFVVVNCAALPAALIESELFGHEKGAFTGATERRRGKFELAQGGTLLLDEVGELPLELQAKLLRVLQEKEVERLGGHELVRVDVRVVAATNRPLKEEAQAGRFRPDLYYRLSAFPVLLPPLRQRPADILPLAEHFLTQLQPTLPQPVQGFSARAVQELYAHAWPGNVRELQHSVERAALLADGPCIETFHLPASPPAAPARMGTPRSLEIIEREGIEQALLYCKGRIRGKGGAAEYLGIQPNTLDHRIRKLGIDRRLGVV